MQAQIPNYLQEEKFEKTEIGLIPKGWNVVRLGEVLEEVKLRAKSLVNYGGIPVFSLSKSKGLIPQEKRFKHRVAKKDVSDYKVIRKGWLVYNPYVIWEGALSTLNKHDVALVSPVYVIFKIKRGNYKYLNHLVKTKKILQRFFSLASGVVQRRRSISKQAFLDVKIPFPPVEEQNRIAYVLSTIQRAMEQQDKIIEATKTLKKSLMRKLFTEGLGNPEFKQTEIGEIPTSWEAVTLGELANSFIGGGTPSTKKTQYWNGKIPWITSAHITGLYLTDGQRYISQRGLADSSTNLIPKNNVLIGTRVGVGKIAINLIDVAINQDLTGMIVDKQRASLEFVAHVLSSNGIQEEFRSRRRGTTIKGITREDLKRIKAPLPPLPEQQEIAYILSSVDKKIEVEERKKATLNELFKTILHRLMTGEIRLIHVEV